MSSLRSLIEDNKYFNLGMLDFRGSPNPYYKPKQSMRIKNKQLAKMIKLTKKK